MVGRITHIQRLSLHDGPGIRSTVFFQGCNLRCPWCHNPETWEAKDYTQVINGEKTTVGRWIESRDLARELLTDREFFTNSGGGVTLSGGEPLLQAGFAAEILDFCKAEGVHTAVETNLLAPWDRIRSLLPRVDLWMCDLKSMDDEKHAACGAGIGRILDNFRKLDATGADILVRTPVIPGFNDTREDIEAICRFLADLPGPVRYELLGFHTLGFDKYTSMGIDNPMAGCAPMDKARLEELQTIASQWIATTKESRD